MVNDAHEIQVVWAHPSRSPALERMLDDREQDRVAALDREDDKRRLVTSHALVRVVVAQAIGLDPSAVRIAARCLRCGGPHGKPVVQALPGMHISIAHAGERVVVAVTRLGPVGVDVEPESAGRFAGFSDVVLGASERNEHERLSAEQRPRAAATWWVRKEAVLKASGHGMLVSPDRVEVSDPTQAPRLVAWRADEPPTRPAHLVDLDLGVGYVGCVAVLARQQPIVRLTDGDALVATWAAEAGTASR
jgi:4'-phosphopantetheinyl transferase